MSPNFATRRGDVLISILNWNGLADTLTCLASIAPKDGDAWDIVVIDNGSAEDPAQDIQIRFPKVECIRLNENLGFTGGQNVGITLALERGYEAVFLLNNDCEIVGADLLELLRQMRADPLIAAISPLIYCSDNRTKPQVVGGWLDWSSHRSIRPSDPDIRIPDKATPVIPGTALLLRCSALVEIGLLDDRYFAYYEDNDISARIAAHGMSATFCKTASAWHQSRPVDGYSSTALYLSARNAWIFWHAYSPENFRIGLLRHLLAQSFYEIASLKKAGAHDKCKAVTAGLWDAYRGKTGRPPTRFGPPAWLNALMVVAPYLMYDLLTSPRNAIASRLKRK